METRDTLRTVVALITIIAVATAFAAPAAAQPSCDRSVDETGPSGSMSCSGSAGSGSGSGGGAVDASGNELTWSGTFQGSNSFGSMAAWTSGNASADGGDGTAGQWDTQSGTQAVSCTVTQSTQDCTTP